MALPLISMELIDDGLQLLKNNIPSTDDTYYRFIKYFQKEYMQRTAVDLWHHGCTDMKTNNSLEGKHYICIFYNFWNLFIFIVLGYNFRLLHRFGLHPSIWEFLHYLKYEEALVSHRITNLGGGGGTTSGTLIYTHMQSKSKAKEKEKQLTRLQDLYYSNFIGLKQYLTSVSLMVGKMPGQNTNADIVDEADAKTHSVNNEDIVD